MPVYVYFDDVKQLMMYGVKVKIDEVLVNKISEIIGSDNVKIVEEQ